MEVQLVLEWCYSGVIHRSLVRLARCDSDVVVEQHASGHTESRSKT